CARESRSTIATIDFDYW
nr:immunoglobulin heavy chain junction region [Macaca mulatta]MOV41319.1 immunoglobulin heavy chain junction region [Macaca mulatta]